MTSLPSGYKFPNHFVTEIPVVDVPRFLLLFVVAKFPSLAIDGMAPFVVVPILLVD